MYWTLELASKLEDAPWPATKDQVHHLRFLRIFRRLKMKVMSMTVSRTSGLTIRQRTISCGMKMNIKTIEKRLYQKRYSLFLFK